MQHTFSQDLAGTLRRFRSQRSAFIRENLALLSEVRLNGEVTQTVTAWTQWEFLENVRARPRLCVLAMKAFGGCTKSQLAFTSAVVFSHVKSPRHPPIEAIEIMFPCYSLQVHTQALKEDLYRTALAKMANLNMEQLIAAANRYKLQLVPAVDLVQDYVQVVDQEGKEEEQPLEEDYGLEGAQANETKNK